MKVPYLLSLSFAVTTIVVGLFSSACANMLVNQGFEKGVTDGWEHWCINSAVTDSQKHSGVYSVELGLPEEYEKGALIQEVTQGFSAGESVYAGAWIKTDGLGGDAFLKLEFWNEEGVEISSVEGKKFTGMTNWTETGVSADAVPGGTTMIKIILQLDSGAGKAKGGKAYFDDASLDVIPEKQPL